MFSQYCSSDYSNKDFNVVQYGHRECAPDFSIHYISCPNYLFHYIYSGKGVFRIKTDDGNIKEYNLSENCAFIIFPGEEAWYTADHNEPFSYRWIEFFGEKAPEFLQMSHLSSKNPIYTACEPFECRNILEQITDMGHMPQTRLTALFWMFVDSIVKEHNRPENNLTSLFNNALEYIHLNINKALSVEDVAAFVGISRGYLSRIFSKFISQSPKQYILSCRINKAKSLLLSTNMSIKEIASEVGYETTSDFTKVFKRLTGYAPTEYKKELSDNTYKHIIVQ